MKDSNDANQGRVTLQVSRSESLQSRGPDYILVRDHTARIYFQQALQLYEKFKVPGDIARTLHNLAETSAKMAEYDQALPSYLRALELWRRAGDKRGEGIESYSMGEVFESQGRYGAALNAKEEALKTFRQLQDRSRWMVEILTGYGGTLVQMGRAEEARKSLDEALSLARELKNRALIAQIMNFEGDSFFYQNDFKSARTLFEQALQLASQTTKDRHLVLRSKVNVSKLAVKEGRFQVAISALKGFVKESDALGLKDLSVESSIYLAEALVNTKDYSHARQELERALEKSEKLGLRMLMAKARYLLATALRLSGKGSEASGYYREALRLLEEISKESGTGNVLQRADLHTVYTDSVRWSRGGKG